MSENIIVSRKAIEQQVLANMYSLSPQADALRAIIETAESADEIERLRAELAGMKRVAESWHEKWLANSRELAAIKEQEPTHLQVRCELNRNWQFVDAVQYEEYISHGWEGRKFYALPAADKDAERSGLEGFSIWFSREQWGAIVDGLILERDRSLGRKKSNSESTSNAKADMCAELIRAVGDASNSAMAKGE